MFCSACDRVANSLTLDLKAVWGFSETLVGQQLVYEAKHDLLASCQVKVGQYCARRGIFDDSRQFCRVNFHGVLAVDKGDWGCQNMQKVTAVLDKGRDMQRLNQVSCLA